MFDDSLTHKNYIIKAVFGKNVLLFYDIKNNKFDEIQVNLIQFGYEKFGATRSNMVGDLVYILGGFGDKWELLDHVLVYDHNKSSISLVSNLLEKRCCHASIVINPFIYSVGGCNKISCERFNYETNSSAFLPSICYCRGKATLMYLHSSNKLFLFGGDIDNKIYCDFLNILDLNNILNWEEVKLINNFNIPFFTLSPGIISLTNEKFLIIGGAHDDQTSDNIFFFDPSNFKFNLLKSKISCGDCFSQDVKFYQIRENKYFQFGSYNSTRLMIELEDIDLNS